MYSDTFNNNNCQSDNIVSSEFSSIDYLLLESHEEQDMFRFILENYHDPVFIVKIDRRSCSGSFVDFNQYFCDHLGYTGSELFHLDPIRICAPETISLVEKSIKKNLREKSMVWEGIVLRKDSSRIPVEIKSYVFNKEGYSLLFVLLRDISSYKQSMQELHNHESLLERAESIARMGYWEYDVKNDKFWASHGARLIYGIGEREISLNEIADIPLSEFRPKLDQMFGNLLDHADKYDVEFKICRQNDNKIIDVRSMAEYDSLEKKIFGIVQDISRQKNVEQELIKAKEKAEESDRLKSSFLSNMSHEIRTPMNGIVGFSHFLAERDLDLETRKEYKEIIYHCCEQLTTTVNDIIDIAKIESEQVVVNLDWVNIDKILKEVLETYAPLALKKNIVLCLHPGLSGENQILFTDQVKLHKIIMNLVDNAVRFTPSGHVEFGYQAVNEFVEFYVKDTGIGISPSHHDIIFRPFCQAGSQISQEYGGTGLGLTITKAYVTLLGGQIWLESKSGEGASFFFTLPIGNGTGKLIEKLPVRKKMTGPKTCLIVEDIELNYIYLKALLKPMGFSVLWARDGNEAIDMALGNEDIDLVLMDIRLPNINGYEATMAIKEKRPNLPIIAQSANALLDERNKALESGCDDYITKPIFKDEFGKIISAFFDD
jgi:PAS domain S-box-containing protein